MRPNLFHFATSELSQDAVLCWLLAWAKPESKQESASLHAVSVKLLRRFFSKAGVECPSKITSLEVRRQEAHIDVLCLVNSEFAVLIEDKVGSIQHSDQLARYKSYVIEKLGIAPDKLVPLYVQTGDQCSFAEVLKHGFHVIERSDILDVLESADGDLAAKESDILGNYRQHLRIIEDDVRSFLRTPLDRWSWNAWKGFYTELQRGLGDGSWDYVSNPAGGFLGFWWHFQSASDAEVYLQLEQANFCFKITPFDGVDRQQSRGRWHELITSTCTGHGLSARRPSRFGSGAYMTVALLGTEYRQLNANGLLDMANTVGFLMRAQSVVDSAIEGEAREQGEQIIGATKVEA